MKKIRKNDPCPCGSGHRYSECCDGTIDWNKLLVCNDIQIPKFLTARGKNLVFMQSIIDLLDVDIRKQIIWKDLKKRITPEIVYKIYSAVEDLWPSLSDLIRVYNQESNNYSALYLGDSDPEFIINSVKKHCLYNETILIADPFPYPLLMKKEFNPLYVPEQFISATLKFLYLWFNLYDWVIAGIVRFVKIPTNFDPKMLHQLLNKGYAKKENKLLMEIAEKEIEKSQELLLMKQYHTFSIPNEVLIRTYKKNNPKCNSSDIKKFIHIIDQGRDNHPYYVKPILDENGKGSELMITQGLNFDTSKLITSITNSHLITCNEFCWKEIELDRDTNNDIDKIWEPFSHTFQNIELNILDNVTPRIALTLREQNKLQKMRKFLQKVWKSSIYSVNFSESNVKLMTDELLDTIKEANEEWKQIDKELLKNFGKDITIASTSFIAQSKTGLIIGGASVAAAGFYELMLSRNKKKMFQKNNPAAFFLNKHIKNV